MRLQRLMTGLAVFATLAFFWAPSALSQRVYIDIGGNGVFEMVLSAGPMVKLVILLLVVMSVACWAVIAMKWRLFRRMRRETDEFAELLERRKGYGALYRESRHLEDSPIAEIFRAGYAEMSRLAKSIERTEAGNPAVWMESVERAMRGASLAESRRLDRYLPLLATTGSTAPFIGLFGTVWGIMTSFQDIGLKGAANLAVVAPGISEALVATAVGLAAAIPAVVFYNQLTNRVRAAESEMDHFSGDLLNMLKRDSARRGRTADETA